MSTQTFTEKRSWRHQAKSSGSHWAARLIATAVLAVLVGGFIYWLLPTPQPQLHPFLIAGLDEKTFDTDVIMPPMHGARARREIKSTLDEIGVPAEIWQSSEIWGTVDDIRNRLKSNMNDALSRKHDLTMVIVRGYLMTDTNGEPSIACSDLGVLPGSNSPQGLLPIKEILDPLTTQAPSGFRGARIVILDVEPLGALPRMNQYGDDALVKLDAQLRQMTAPWSDRLWVLVTRPPMQSPGWDPVAKLPVSTQTFLQAFSGEAKITDEWLELRDLAASMNARYKRLDPSGSLGILVMQGGKGQINHSEDLPKIRIARVVPTTSSEAAQAEDDGSDSANDNDTQGAANESTALPEQPMGVSLARYRPAVLAAKVVPVARHAQAASTVADSHAADPPPTGSERESASADARNPDTGAAAAKERSAAVPADAPLQQTAPQTTSFWDHRDRLERDVSDDSLHPLAIAPHLWRRLILNVLHAEIESESESAASATLLSDAQRSLEQLELAIHDPDPPATLAVPSNLVKQMYRDWREAGRSEHRRRIGELVNSADTLQYTICVARSRWWSLQLFQQQAIANGCQPLAISSDWERELRAAEAVLVAQVGDTASQRLLDQAADNLWKLIRGSQETIGDNVDRLLADLSRRRRGNQSAWKGLRLAYVFLRSPLPSGEQRRQLQTAIDTSVLEQLPKKDFAEIGNQSFANVEESNLTRSVVRQIRNQQTSWERPATATVTDGFATSFADVLRMDPRDASATGTRELPLHAVTAPQHDPAPDALLADSSEMRLDQELLLNGLDDHLWVRILPDAEERTDYRLSLRLQNLATEQPLSFQWQEGPGVTSIDQQSATLSVPAGKQGGKIRIDIKSSGFADEMTSNVKFFVDIEPLSEATTPHVKDLRVSKSLRIGLPERNRIQVAVRCEGLSKQTLSNDEDNFSRGIWLRTFASRETRFRLSLLNSAEQACRAKVWLIRLRNPFQGVSAYWPDLLRAKLEDVRGSLLQANGQVRQSVLDGDQMIRGPQKVELGGGGAMTDLNWKPADSAAEEGNSAAPTAPSPNAGPADGIDVTHGMALVIRLVDEQERALAGGDQIVWLFPKPWRPDQYVQITSMRYRSGEVQIKAAMKRQIDRDNKDDAIPELNRKAVSIRWQEDPAWTGFDGRDKTRDLQAQVLNLSFGGLDSIEVPVNSDHSESAVTLDVDDWPRALRWVIDHRQEARGRPQTAGDTVNFAAVTMLYGDNPPGEKGDDPVTDTKLYYPDADVAFRGGGERLKLQLRADFSEGVYAEIDPPEIRFSEGEGDGLLRTFWSDRALQTTLSEVKDDGWISLVTAVSDLVIERTNDASRRDAVFNYRVNLRGDRSDSAELRVTLDSSPPDIDRFLPNQRYLQVGDELQLRVSYSDQQTSVKEIVVAADMDGDGNPDGKRVSVFGKPKPYQQQLKLDQPNDELTLLAQVWDQVGNRSEPKTQVIRVKAKPKPAPAATLGNPATPPPRGHIRGRIATGSTLRGDLYLLPVPSDMQPAGGSIEIARSNPSFNFSNLPPQEYTLIFDGTVQGSDKGPRAWKGLKIHNAGGRPQWELKLRDASDPDDAK